MSSTSTPSGTTPPDILTSSQLFQARMKAHDVVQEHLKQIITVASATLALTITFLKDILGPVGEHTSWGVILPFSWVCLGLSIFVAILSIAALVNNLDAPDPDDASRSFAAGGNRSVQLPVLFSFLLFGLGMLALGVFAARNYDLFLHRTKTDYKIRSALQAIDESKKQLPPSSIIVNLTKAELIKGANETSGLPIWHVQFEIKKAGDATAEKTTAANPFLTPPILCRHNCRYLCRCAPVIQSEQSTTSFNCLLDAKSGEILNVP